MIEASIQDSSECVEILIKAGANINQANKYQNTPLHCASTNNNKDVVDVLIKYKADIMRKNYVRNLNQILCLSHNNIINYSKNLNFSLLYIGKLNMP
jgi:ankyrin repeat protein